MECRLDIFYRFYEEQLMYNDQHHQLLIMRHAKSAWDSGVSQDFDRPLTPRGCGDAKKVGAWMCAQNILPDLCLSSPAKRAQATALIVANELGMSAGDIILEEKLYDASLNDLLLVLSENTKDKRKVWLIGHNPGLDALLCYLARAEPARTPSGKLMTTSALAILDYGFEPISGERGSASLLKMLRPKELS
jgi:phosphohistidine phosphatase